MNFNHLKEINEGYFKHAKCSSLYAMLFVGLSIVSIIHAIFPFVFCTTVSDKLEEMQNHLEKRKCKM